MKQDKPLVVESGRESRLDSAPIKSRELDSGLDSARDSGDLKAAINLPPFIRFAIEILESSGFEAFVVGGCVRDSLLGITPKDWDITTDATPEKIALAFSKYECKALNIGEKFGTIGVLIKEENTHFVEWQEKRQKKWCAKECEILAGRENLEGEKILAERENLKNENVEIENAESENLDSADHPHSHDKQPQNRQQKHHQKTHCQKTHCQKIYCIEITTYRHDTAYKDHRHPESVRFCQSLVEDLSRRDFTCNALAYSPHLDSADSGANVDSDALLDSSAQNLAYKKSFGKNIAAKYGNIVRGGICDAFGGVDDMRAQILRCVGDARQRFDEDALRILRALRFSATLGFTIEPRTRDALLQRAPKLAHISLERKSNEWLKTLRAPHARGVISEYLRVWAVVFAPFESEILLLARGGESMHEADSKCETESKCEAESKSGADSADKMDSSLESTLDSARAIYARFCRHLALLDDVDSALYMLQTREVREIGNAPESAKSPQSKAKPQAPKNPESSGLDSDALDSILRLCVWFFALSKATRAINAPKLDSNPESALRAKSTPESSTKPTSRANALPAESATQSESDFLQKSTLKSFLPTKSTGPAPQSSQAESATNKARAILDSGAKSVLSLESATRAESTNTTAKPATNPTQNPSQKPAPQRADMAQITQSLGLLRLSKAMTQTCLFLLERAHIPLASHAPELKIWARDFGIARARILLAFLWLTRPSERGDIARAKELLEPISAQCYSLGALAINGNDIKRLALEIGANISGKEVGGILEKLLESVINDELPNTKTALQTHAKIHIKQQKLC